MPHSKREYDRLQIKYENTYQRWRKVIGLNKNLLRKLARRDDAIAQLKLEVTALKARESKLIKEDSQRQVQAVESQKKNRKIFPGIATPLFKSCCLSSFLSWVKLA